MYPPLPSALSIGAQLLENPQIPYHLNIIRSKRRGLINKEAMFEKKYEKYTKILN